MKYNLGKYNLKEQLTKISGNAVIELFCDLKKIIIEKSESLLVKIGVESTVRAILEKTSTANEIKTDIDCICEALVIIGTGKIKSDLEIQATAIGAILGEETLIFSNLDLNPNETLIIDMCSMMAIVDQRNANKNISSGDFFEFFPTSNEMIITSDGNINIDIEWRDRWL